MSMQWSTSTDRTNLSLPSLASGKYHLDSLRVSARGAGAETFADETSYILEAADQC